MLSRRLLGALNPRAPSVCLFCSTRALVAPPPHARRFNTTRSLLNSSKKRRKRKQKFPNVALADVEKIPEQATGTLSIARPRDERTAKDGSAEEGATNKQAVEEQGASATTRKSKTKKEAAKAKPAKSKPAKAEPAKSQPAKAEPAKSKPAKAEPAKSKPAKAEPAKAKSAKNSKGVQKSGSSGKPEQLKTSIDPKGLQMSLKDAMLALETEKKLKDFSKKSKPAKKATKKNSKVNNLPVELISASDLDFQPVDHKIPPIPMLSHGLDRVLFNPGVYRLQDPRSRVYNFDPYLEKIMPATEFDFDALAEYKTSSQDEELLAITRKEGTKFTGSTSSMSSALQHFHFLLSAWRPLNHEQLSRRFPISGDSKSAITKGTFTEESLTKGRFSKITKGPSAIFLRWKNGLYAIDADKSYDSPNIMSWLGHSLETLLTNPREEFERYRRSNKGEAPSEGDSGKCFHYSKLGNFLMRSQLDAHDKRLPGTGVFDLKTRAVVSIRMDHTKYEEGAGYQLRYDHGEWQSYEREFFDMTRATLLKYSLQVRMGRMDGIFVAYHNIERIFGFQYFSLPDMDRVLHGQIDTCLGDQEFKLSIRLLDEVLQQATKTYPKTSIRLHFETRESTGTPFMYIFAEPVTEEQADTIQNSKSDLRKAFEREHIGVNRDDPEVQAEWQELQSQVDDQIDEDDRTSESPANNEDSPICNESIDTEESTGAKESTVSKENSIDEDSTAANEIADAKESIPSKDVSSSDSTLMGWTLTVRNLVNGVYVPRPTNFSSTDSWTIEYVIKPMATDSCIRTYNQAKARREKLMNHDSQEADKQLQAYRKVIRRFTEKGRKWRKAQDKIDQEMGRRIYSPMGPGSEDVKRQMGPRYEGDRVM